MITTSCVSWGTSYTLSHKEIVCSYTEPTVHARANTHTHITCNSRGRIVFFRSEFTRCLSALYCLTILRRFSSRIILQSTYFDLTCISWMLGWRFWMHCIRLGAAWVTLRKVHLEYESWNTNLMQWNPSEKTTNVSFYYALNNFI